MKCLKKGDSISNLKFYFLGCLIFAMLLFFFVGLTVDNFVFIPKSVTKFIVGLLLVLEFYLIFIFSRNVDIEKKMKTQRETYIATLSHDLKTPAIAQIRALKLVLDGQFGDLNSGQKDMLQLTLDSCNYMYDMIYTLLSACKFENGAVTLNYSKFCIQKLIYECINEMTPFINESAVTVAFNPEIPEVEVYADKIELKRVIMNLLSNAINYAYSDTVVTVTIAQNSTSLFLEIINSSPYIEPKVMSGLFEKYVTHSSKYNKIGIGLGLYLSKQIIEAHKGEIIAKSSKNQVNTFGFKIPISSVNKLSSSEVLSSDVIFRMF